MSTACWSSHNQWQLKQWKLMIPEPNRVYCIYQPSAESSCVPNITVSSLPNSPLSTLAHSVAVSPSVTVSLVLVKPIVKTMSRKIDWAFCHYFCWLWFWFLVVMYVSYNLWSYTLYRDGTHYSSFKQYNSSLIQTVSIQIDSVHSYMAFNQQKLCNLQTGSCYLESYTYT